MTTAQANVRIGIWGATGSGKTTFLGALQLASLREPGSQWMLFGRDDQRPGSIRFLAESSIELNQRHRFPPASTGRQRYLYSVSGHPSSDLLTQIRDGLFRQQREVSFLLDLYDEPGELFDISNMDFQDELWDYLASCDGIIYLFDPLLEVKGTSNFQYLTSALQFVTLAATRLSAGNRLINERLPQYLAVCLTKYDDPGVFRQLWQAGLIAVDARAPRVVPRVKDPQRAFDLFTDGLTRSMLTSFFLPDRIQYFATSAIGFRATQPGMLDPNNCQNVDETPDGARILGDIYPVDIFAPLVWIAGRTASRR